MEEIHVLWVSWSIFSGVPHLKALFQLQLLMMRLDEDVPFEGSFRARNQGSQTPHIPLHKGDLQIELN